MRYKVIYSNELYHYGVKGMRWGVRKSSSKLSESIRKTAKNKWEEHKNRQNLKKQARKNIKELKKMSRYRQGLSDKDLDKMVQRLEKEKKVKDLMDSQISPGRKFAKDVMSSTSKKVLITALSGASLYLAKHYVEQKMKTENFNNSIDWAQLADSVWRGGAKKK